MMQMATCLLLLFAAVTSSMAATTGDDDVSGYANTDVTVESLLQQLAAVKSEIDDKFYSLQKGIDRKADRRQYTGPVTYAQVGFGCDTDIVTLLCTNNRTINISSAHYGIYADACDVSCCAAAAGDCTESLQETAPLDWQNLLTLCQNQSFCQFEHPGRSLSSCAEPIDSDYVIVSYTCQPEDEAPPAVTFDPVGFTAAAEGDDFEPGDVIQFPNVLYNRGDAYSSFTGVFTCPVRGMYNFHASLLSDWSQDAVASIHHDNDVMCSLFGYDVTLMQGATSCVFECDVGDEVYLEADVHSGQGTANDGGTEYNTFSGHLIAPL